MLFFVGHNFKLQVQPNTGLPDKHWTHINQISSDAMLFFDTGYFISTEKQFKPPQAHIRKANFESVEIIEMTHSIS